jgi:DNA-binding transcriptional LysR family regulator
VHERYVQYITNSRRPSPTVNIGLGDQTSLATGHVQYFLRKAWMTMQRTVRCRCGSARFGAPDPTARALAGLQVEPPQRRQHLVQGGKEQLSILRREYQRRALRSVTMAGFGVAALPCYLADPALELRRVTTPLPDTEGSLWLFTHGDLRKVARIRTVLDFIADALSRQRGLIEGTTSQTRRA